MFLDVLGQFMQFLMFLYVLGVFWGVLEHFRMFGDVLGHIGPFWCFFRKVCNVLGRLGMPNLAKPTQI